MVVDLNRKSVACNRSVVVKFKKTIESISSDISKAFLKYPWPGNQRELDHTMEHAFVHRSCDPLLENQKIQPH